MTKKFVHYITNVIRPEITLHPVKSGKLKALGHDPVSNTLAASFPTGSGAIYHYPGFSADDYKALIEAESVGKHFIANVQHLPFDKYVPVQDAPSDAS